MNSQNYPERNLWFVLALIFVLLFSTGSINFDVTGFIQREEIRIPNWYFYLIFSIDLLTVLSLLLIFFYRKVGVVIFPLAVFMHFLMQNFYLSNIMYFDLFQLFLYFGLILFLAIPRWKYFS